MKATLRKGFTLIEILIVVIILGILAAIVIPQFTSASEDAKKASLASQLQTLRGQVELYKLQHRDSYPNGADGAVSTAYAPGTGTALLNFNKLTQKTDEDGVVASTGKFGPYLQATPVNALNGNTVVANAPGEDVGWIIDANGKVFATGKNEAQFFDEKTKTDSAAAPEGFTAVGE